jgi:hypothetical protein
MSAWLWNRPDPNDITTKAKVRVNRFSRSTDEAEKKQLLEELQEIVGDVATHEEVGAIIPHLIRFMEKKDDLGTTWGWKRGGGVLRECVSKVHLVISPHLSLRTNSNNHSRNLAKFDKDSGAAVRREGGRGRKHSGVTRAAGE